MTVIRFNYDRCQRCVAFATLRHNITTIFIDGDDTPLGDASSNQLPVTGAGRRPAKFPNKHRSFLHLFTSILRGEQRRRRAGRSIKGNCTGDDRSNGPRMPITRGELSPPGTGGHSQGPEGLQGPCGGSEGERKGGGAGERGRWTESRAYLIYLPDNTA